MRGLRGPWGLTSGAERVKSRDGRQGEFDGNVVSDRKPGKGFKKGMGVSDSIRMTGMEDDFNRGVWKSL